MRLGKLVSTRTGFLVVGDGELGIFKSLEQCEKAIKDEMAIYRVGRNEFTIYIYSETKQVVNL